MPVHCMDLRQGMTTMRKDVRHYCITGINAAYCHLFPKGGRLYYSSDRSTEMVQQLLSAMITVKLKEVAENVASARSDQELNRERVEDAKTAAIHNWLNSKICGKAC